MKANWLHRILGSVFSKLLLVIFITGMLINFVVIGFFWHHRIRKDRIPFGKNAVHYINYLITDLGNPPSLEKAKEISKKFYITIRFKGPDKSWTTSDMDNQGPGRHGMIIYQDSDARIMHYRGMNLIVADKEYGRFEFSTTRTLFTVDAMLWSHVALMGIISVLLVVAFFIIRQILKPIKHLSNGVREVGAGNLEYKVSVTRSDEFGELTEAFNTMTEKISDMLQTREQLMIDVSHELRTPITRMKVALEFLPRGKERKTLSDDVVEMENMVTEILESARLRSKGNDIAPVRTNLSGLVQKTANLFKDQLPGIIIEQTLENSEVSVDPKMINTVLKNIFINAIKYSDKKGDPVNVSMRKNAGQIIIDIHDSGAGIPEDELPHIFEPFYRVDKSRSKHTGGYGLGLSLCKTIMDAHEGKIEVGSTLGKGTTVSLFFNNR